VTTQKATTKDAFSRDKLRVARQFAGIKQTDLADELGVSRQYVYQFEAGVREPNAEVISALAQVLKVEPEFFFGPLVDEFREDECHFRRRRTTPVNVRQQALAHGTMFGMVVAYLDGSLRWPRNNLPEVEYRGLDDIERVADRCRVHWGLGVDRPVDNMTRLLETSGTVVSCFAGPSEKVDAFSRGGKRNIAVLSTLKDSAVRTRYDLAHELGHLCLHSGLGPPDSPEKDERRELEADRFAGAFLLPKTGFAREFPRQAIGSRIKWPDLLEFKRRWLVSLGAIIRRAFTLGVVDSLGYRRANISLRSNGWYAAEPLDDKLPVERPEIVDLSMAEMERSFGVTSTDVAKHLRFKPQTFEKIIGAKVEPPPVTVTSGPIVTVATIHRMDHYRAKA
jgi:Zn-dependent peptidase ImmA (M78 family)/transcriptional regulator with XRE-family HTH domain